MSIFAISGKVWPSLLAIVLIFIAVGLDELGFHRFSSGIAFLLCIVCGWICIILVFKDAFWPKG